MNHDAGPGSFILGRSIVGRMILKLGMIESHNASIQEEEELGASREKGCNG